MRETARYSAALTYCVSREARVLADDCTGGGHYRTRPQCGGIDGQARFENPHVVAVGNEADLLTLGFLSDHLEARRVRKRPCARLVQVSDWQQHATQYIAIDAPQ